MAQSTSLATTGNSAAITLNPVAKTTTIQLTASASTAGNVVDLWYTLDDPTTTPAPTMTWALLSSAIGVATNTGVFDVGGLTYTVVSPLGGLRLHSSVYGAATVTMTLKALQAVTA